MTEALPIAWLTTGRGPGSYGALAYLLDAIANGLPVTLSVLFVNRARGEAEPTDRLLQLAADHRVPVEALSSVAFRKQRGAPRSRPGQPLPGWRVEFDAEVARLLARHDFAIGVLFGYMLIATRPLHDRFTLLNDHPALPDGPTGTYLEVIADLIRQQATRSGCMMNLVTGEVDRGPVVTLCRYTLRDPVIDPLWEQPQSGSGSELESSALFQEIRRRQIQYERPLVVETLRAIAERRLAIPTPIPLDLTDTVEALIHAP